MTKYSYLSLLILMLMGCNKHKVNSCEQVTISENSLHKKLKMNGTLQAHIDSFALKLKQQADSKNICPIAYIVLETIDNDSLYKVRMETIYDTMIHHIKYDDYFVNQGVYFLIDYNFDHLIDQRISSNFLNFLILLKSKFILFRYQDTAYPSWLILMNRNETLKINKKAFSLFSPDSQRIAEFTENGLKCYELNEWGEIIGVFDCW